MSGIQNSNFRRDGLTRLTLGIHCRGIYDNGRSGNSINRNIKGEILVSRDGNRVDTNRTKGRMFSSHCLIGDRSEAQIIFCMNRDFHPLAGFGLRSDVCGCDAYGGRGIGNNCKCICNGLTPVAGCIGKHDGYEDGIPGAAIFSQGLKVHSKGGLSVSECKLPVDVEIGKCDIKGGSNVSTGCADTALDDGPIIRQH